MAKKAGQKIVTLEQWVEVTVREGKTATTLYPPNEALRERAQKMDPPPDMVYRRLNFIDCVPVEYYWTTDDPVRRTNGGHGIQRMAVDTWLEAIAREEQLGNGHVGPCSQPLPRPKSRGGCDCEVCAALRERCERLGIAAP
jgi:hypothetical protein